jgi:phage-related protein
MHFEYLTALITQYRGIELCLKFLSQDLSTFLTNFVLHVTEMQSPRPRDSTPEPEHDSSDSDTERDADMITHSGSDLSAKELQRRVVELNVDLTRTHPHESRALHAVTSTVKLLRKMIREHPFRIAYVVKFKAQVIRLEYFVDAWYTYRRIVVDYIEEIERNRSRGVEARVLQAN